MIESPIDIKAFLIKNSLMGFLGRRREEQVILYIFISRLILLFQKPVSILIYENNNWEKPVFKSLDTTSVSQFGDQELAILFEKQIKNIKIFDDYAFRFLGTNYKFIFFAITYSERGIIEDTSFNPVKRDDEIFGFALKYILDDNISNSFEIKNIIKNKNFIENLQNCLHNELLKFPIQLPHLKAIPNIQKKL